LPSLTENTITDEDELYEELAEIRERGYSINNQETIPGLRAIGVPIECPDGGVLARSACPAPHTACKATASMKRFRTFSSGRRTNSNWI